MSADTIRMIGTYAIAVVVLGGCFILLVFPSQVTQEALLPFVTGTIGMVLGWVFNRESTTGGQRATERAIKQGSDSVAPTTVNASGDTTVTGGDPTTVHVTKK